MLPEINTPEEENKGLSVIVNPFVQDALEKVSINYAKNIFTEEGYWYASVAFKNINTIGVQRLGNCETFEEIVLQVKNLLNEIKSKS